jgi:hypothetical protein
MKNPDTAIEAMITSSCQPELTTLLKTYPKVYPQKLRIISEVQALSYQGKSEIWAFFNRFYWQELSKLLIKQKFRCNKITDLL